MAVRPVEEQDCEEEAMEAECEFGARKAEMMRSPSQPSGAEVEEHEKTHLPFRSWCRHCVRRKGKQAEHRRLTQEEVGPELHMDFAFMGDEESEELLTILVAKERTTRMLMSTVVQAKSSVEFAAKRTLAFLREIGCEHVAMTVKSDNEPAMSALVTQIGKLRAANGGQRFSVEMSPAYSSASNGVVERGVQTVQGQVRVLRSAVEEKWRVKLETAHSIWPWLVEYASFLINRGEVGHDGKTPYERCKAKRGKLPGLAFGEKILWRRRPVGGNLSKLTCLWEDGIFLGVKGSSGEYIVGDGNGVWKTRTLMRRPLEERWDKGALVLVGGVPWRVNDDDPKADGEAMKMDIPSETRQATKQEKEVMAQAPIPRNFYITKEHLTKYGYSQDCPGCKSLLRGRRGKLTIQHAGEDLRGKLLMIRRSGDPSKSRTNSSPRRWKKKKKKREGRDHGWKMIMNQSYLRPHP